MDVHIIPLRSTGYIIRNFCFTFGTINNDHGTQLDAGI
jgi:hypothetical protein